MKRFRLPRRTFLKAAGISIALPTLDAMVDDRGRWFMGEAHAAGPMAPPVRVMAFHFPHGVVLRNFTPATQGKGYAITRILAPLAAHQPDFNVLTGINQNACKMGGIGGDHARGMPCFASASIGTAAGSGGPTFDQVLASELGSATKFPSIVANNQPAGTITEGATTAHMNNISWSSAGNFVPATRDPQALFMQLVSSIAPTTGGSVPVAQPLSPQKKSVLDHVLAELTSLGGRVGAADKARLDEYTTSLREVERQLMAPPAMVAGCTAPAPIGDTTDFSTRAKVFLQLIALAFKCDLTRYASFAMSCGFDTHVYPELTSIQAHHHDITHMGNYGPGPNGELETQFAIYYMGLLAYLLDQLKAAPEGAGTVLDNSLIYFGSEMAEGWHTMVNMPIVLAGGAGGHVSTGQHIVYPAGTPMAKVFLTILKAAGSKTTTFGYGGTDVLPGILQ